MFPSLSLGGNRGNLLKGLSPEPVGRESEAHSAIYNSIVPALDISRGGEGGRA